MVEHNHFAAIAGNSYSLYSRDRVGWGLFFVRLTHFMKQAEKPIDKINIICS